MSCGFKLDVNDMSGVFSLHSQSLTRFLRYTSESYQMAFAHSVQFGCASFLLLSFSNIFKRLFQHAVQNKYILSSQSAAFSLESDHFLSLTLFLRSASRSSRLQAIYSDMPCGYIPVSMPLCEFVIFSNYMRWPQRWDSSVWTSSVLAIRLTESASLANYLKPALRLALTCRAYGHLYGRQSDHVISGGPIFAQIHCNTSENKSAEGA